MWEKTLKYVGINNGMLQVQNKYFSVKLDVDTLRIGFNTLTVSLKFVNEEKWVICFLFLE